MKAVRILVLSTCLAATSGVLGAAYDDLINAANLGDARTVAGFIDRGLDVNSVDPRGETLLIIASRAGHLDLVKALLDRRARLEAVNAVGETALAVAAYNGHAEIVDLLLAKGADPVNTQGWSALHYAAMQGHAAPLKALIARGAPVDAPAPNGATALMLAARSNNIDTVRILLAARADARVRGRDGETAVDWALKVGNTDAAALIRKSMGGMMDDERQLPSHSPLGRSTDYPDRYDAGLLFPMQRIASRQSLGLLPGQPLPFAGIDRWHAWEISWLDPHGKPQVAIGRFDVPADSLCMVESKSLKLYLNSYNNERMVSREAVRALIETDLSAACQAGVMVELYALDALPALIGTHVSEPPGESIDAPDLSFDRYQPDDALLSAGGDLVDECLRSDLLKTNCPVTLQPDWATLVVRYRGPRIDREGLLRYVVSFRNHADFHEHCVERIYMDLLQRCRPELLTVNACYTRRGGLDINPWRSNFEQPDERFVKLARQ